MASSTGLQSSNVLSLLALAEALVFAPFQRLPLDVLCETVGVKISTVSLSISAALAVVIIIGLGGGGRI